MMKITGLSHLLKWENLHNWWLTKYFFAPLYIYACKYLQSTVYTCMCVYLYIHNTYIKYAHIYYLNQNFYFGCD